MHKKIPKICTGCRVSKAKIYLYHSTEIAKARPHSEEWQTDTSVQKPVVHGQEHKKHAQALGARNAFDRFWSFRVFSLGQEFFN